MNLFEFTPNETGYDSFYVMSDSLEEAIKAIKNISDPESNTADFEKQPQV